METMNAVPQHQHIQRNHVAPINPAVADQWKKAAGCVALIAIGFFLANTMGNRNEKQSIMPASLAPMTMQPMQMPAPIPAPAPVQTPTITVVNTPAPAPAPVIIERIVERQGPSVTIVQPSETIVIEKAYPNRTIIWNNPAVVHVVR